MSIQYQFGIIQKVQMSPILQTSFLPWTFLPVTTRPGQALVCCLIFSYLSNFEHGVWNFKCKFKKWTKLFQSLNKGTKHLPIQDFKMTKSHFEVRRKHWWFSNHVNCKQQCMQVFSTIIRKKILLINLNLLLLSYLCNLFQARAMSHCKICT